MPYVEGRRWRMVVLGAAAIGQAAAQTGGWLLVRAAIDSGIQTGDKRYLAEMVVHLPARRGSRLGALGIHDPRACAARPESSCSDSAATCSTT